MSEAAGSFPPEAWRSTFDAVRGVLPRDSLPSVSQLADERVTPFQILVSTMISLRTRDEVTIAASRRLFAEAATPEAVLDLPEEEIARLIFPAGFYRNKAAHIRQAARTIVETHGGTVPRSAADLTALPGVGPKTANLVLGLGFGIPAICVDTHVHRISNRIGWVRTGSPESTETALREILPREHWIEINELFVAFGQRICTPQSPRCSVCPVAPGAAGETGRRARPTEGPSRVQIDGRNRFVCRQANVGSTR